MKKQPSKIRLDKNENKIEISPRDKTPYDIGVRIFGFVFCAFVLFAFIIEPPHIGFMIMFLLIFLLLVVIPIWISFITLKDSYEISYNKENLIIQKHGLIKSKIEFKTKDILSVELRRVTPNSEPFNAYIGFRSAFRLFDDFIPSIGLKGRPPMSVLQYHDKEIRKWIVEHLKSELNIK
ncbi:hypothetical protein [Lentimicrobium sp. S6]|uniref:hypothetical protein n=1 Tax=Lentimicrobium sp. S6 TaxID=2735872 RepID=UPI00155593A6|nr:hypothetical protein [Lentimicrobium sp. S6]NPD48282.1 hypothetical protein [Lentimicrobium sp. S6]